MIIKLAAPIPNIRNIIGNIKTKRSQTFREIAREGKADIKVELRLPKSGTAKLARRKKYGRTILAGRVSPARRSASGESLARDSGASEKLISSSKQGDSIKIGFLDDPLGFNYVAFHEDENNRPTIKKSMQRTLPKMIAAVNRNFKL